MEPFGLLNFLKTLLSPTEENGKNLPKTQDFTPSFDEVQAQESPPAPETEKELYPDGDMQNNAQNAFLCFLDRHESRAKKLRK